MRHRRAWLIAIAALALFAALTAAYPVVRTFADFDIKFNEGWNATRATMVLRGIPLYGAPPQYTITNYPPLSFHLIALASHLAGDVNSAGRYVSLLSLAAIAIFIAAIIRRFAPPPAGIYGALLFVLWLAIFSPSRIGMNEPQLLATAFSLAALYFFLKRPGSAVSAVLFAVSLFTKNNLLALPLACGAYLLLTRSWRRFAIWSATLAVTGLAFLAATLKFDGPYFFAHLLAPRVYSYHDAFSKSADFLAVFQIGLAAAILWSWQNRSRTPRNLLILAFLFATALACAFSGGIAVDRNIFFDPMIVMAILLAIALADLEALVPQAALFGVVLLIPLAGIGGLAAYNIVLNARAFAEIPAREQAFSETTRFIAERPGRALCGDPLVCFTAGKQEEMLMFFVASQVRLGKIPESDILNLIDTYRFQSIEISLADLAAPEFFSPAFLQELNARYRVALRNRDYVIFVPNV